MVATWEHAMDLDRGTACVHLRVRDGWTAMAVRLWGAAGVDVVFEPFLTVGLLRVGCCCDGSGGGGRRWGAHLLDPGRLTYLK